MTNKIKLPSTPSEESLRMLLRAKLMLSHSLEHACHQTDFDNMVAILGLDNAVESLLRCVASSLDLESITGKSFDIVELSGLASSINKALDELAGVRLSYLGDIKVLRQIRNLVQHGAIAPQADLERFIKITEGFFDKTLHKVFGFRLAELKISAGIKNKVVKEFLQLSEQAIESNDWLASIVASRNAFENEYFNKIKDANISLSLYPNIVRAKQKDEFAVYGLQTIKEELELSSLGINDQDYRHFESYLRHIPSNFCSEDTGGQCVMQRDWCKEDAVFCYNFAANTILRWQSKEKQRFYTYKPDKEYRWEETFGGIKLGKESVHGCSYIYDDQNRLSLIYTTKAKKRRFEKLPVGKFYSYKTVTFIDGKKEREHEETIELLGVHSFLVTNEPERWSVIVWYRSIQKRV